MDLQSASLSASRSCGSSSYSLGLHAWAGGGGGGSGLVALAGGCSVCLYLPESGALLAVLGGHGVGVRVVRWLAVPSPARGCYGDETELVSGGGDGLVRVWRIEHCRGGGGACSVPHALSATLAGHAGPVCALATLHLGRGSGDVIATTGADSTLRLWHRAGGSQAWASALAPARLRCACEAVAVSRLPGAPAAAAALHALLLAVGGTDCRVHLFATAAADGAQLSLVPMAVLSGHANWVKSLAFSAHATLQDHFPRPCPEAQPQPLYLASASQDGKCRMWRVDAVSPSGVGGGAGEAVPALAVFDGGAGRGGGRKRRRRRRRMRCVLPLLLLLLLVLVLFLMLLRQLPLLLLRPRCTPS
jgi:WD40 repeat protein